MTSAARTRSSPGAVFPGTFFPVLVEAPLGRPELCITPGWIMPRQQARVQINLRRGPLSGGSLEPEGVPADGLRCVDRDRITTMDDQAGLGWPSASLAIVPLTCAFGAPRGIRTPNRQIRSLVLCVDLVGSRRIWPAHVGGLVGPDGSRRIQKDRLDDQTDDQGPSDRIGCQGKQGAFSSFRSPTRHPRGRTGVGRVAGP